MQAVKVNAGVLILIPGQDKRALLSLAQLEARAHNVTVLKTFGELAKDRKKDNRVFLIEPGEPLHFKAGEVVGIDIDKSRLGKVDVVTSGPIAKVAAEITAEDGRDKIADQQAKADAEAKAKLQDEARAAWQASTDLQKQYPKVEDYLAAQDLV